MTTYIVSFSDPVFQGGDVTIKIKEKFDSDEDLVAVLLPRAVAQGRTLIENTGFIGLLEAWDSTKWHIHEPIDRTSVIWVCSHY